MTVPRSQQRAAARRAAALSVGRVLHRFTLASTAARG